MSNLVEVSVPMPSAAAAERAQAYLTKAQAVVIRNTADYEAAGDDLKAIKGKWKEIEETRKSLKKPIDEAAARIQAFFSAPLGFLTKAETIVKQKLVAFSDEQERIQGEEQRRINEAAEKERQRLAEIAERAAAKGQQKKAETFADRAAAVQAPIVQSEAPKVAGVNFREVWDFEITDPAHVNPEFMMVDEAKIRRTVTALKADAAGVVGPGVRVFTKKQLASAAR